MGKFRNSPSGNANCGWNWAKGVTLFAHKQANVTLDF